MLTNTQRIRLWILSWSWSHTNCFSKLKAVNICLAKSAKKFTVVSKHFECLSTYKNQLIFEFVIYRASSNLFKNMEVCFELKTLHLTNIEGRIRYFRLLGFTTFYFKWYSRLSTIVCLPKNFTWTNLFCNSFVALAELEW